MMAVNQEARTSLKMGMGASELEAMTKTAMAMTTVNMMDRKQA